MIIYRPVRSNFLSQKFGENKACVAPNGRVYAKRNGVCPAGTQDFYPSIGMKGHNGLDFSTWHGEPLFFNIAGLTTKWRAVTEIDGAGGIGLNIISTEKVKIGNREEHIKFKFWHLKKILVNDGDEVVLGQLIAECDNTGASSGDHLHFGFKFCLKNGTPLDRGNGYYGGIDPYPFFENVFVLDKLQVKEDAYTPLDNLYKLVFHMKRAGNAQAEIVQAIAEVIRSFSQKVVASIKGNNNMV